VVQHPRVVRRLLPGSCAGTARPRRFLPGRRAGTGQEPGRNRAGTGQEPGRNRAGTGRRAGTGQEPGRNRAGAGQQPHGRTTPIRNLKTLAFAAISIFLPVVCSAEKRLTTRTRTCRGRAPEAAPDHHTRQIAPLLCGRFLKRPWLPPFFLIIATCYSAYLPKDAASIGSRTPCPDTASTLPRHCPDTPTLPRHCSTLRHSDTAGLNAGGAGVVKKMPLEDRCRVFVSRAASADRCDRTKPHATESHGVTRATVAVARRAGWCKACVPCVVQLRSAERESLLRPACQARQSLRLS